MARFDDTQLRALIDLQDAYDATLRLWQDLDRHSGRMNWKTISGRDDLPGFLGPPISWERLGGLMLVAVAALP
jgi:hypothetical protein